jgi:hypothetical protein
VTTGGLRPAISEPLDLFPPGADPLSAQAQRRCIVAFLAIGLALRLVRYLLRFPLWEDEAMLSANLIDRGPLELLRPLDYVQVAPPLFLWGQLAATRLLGYTEYTLRLIPFLCGMGSLFLFPRVAGRLIRGTPLVLAVGLFAVSYPMTRYSAEAKQYGCDLLLALVMLALAVEWLRRPEQTGWLWALAAMVVPAVGYSFPVLFVGGGISLVVGGVLVKSRQEERRKTPGTFLGLPAHAAPADATGRKMGPSPAARAWRAWLALDLLLAVSFAVVLIVNRWAVGPSNQELMEGIWANAFPPITRPLKLIAWLAEIHAGGMLGYPVGGPNWGSTASLLAWLGGVAILARWRQGLLLGLFLAPLGLNFVAAAIHRFPYGEHARLTLYEAPAFCMLIALGAGGLVAWDAARRQKRDPASAKPQAADDPSGRVALAAGQCPPSIACPLAAHGQPPPGRRTGPAGGAGRRQPPARPNPALQVGHHPAGPRVRPLVLGRYGLRLRAGVLRDRPASEGAASAGRVAVGLVGLVPVQPADLRAPACRRRIDVGRPRFSPAAAALHAVSLDEQSARHPPAGGNAARYRVAPWAGARRPRPLSVSHLQQVGPPDRHGGFHRGF